MCGAVPLTSEKMGSCGPMASFQSQLYTSQYVVAPSSTYKTAYQVDDKQEQKRYRT